MKKKLTNRFDFSIRRSLAVWFVVSIGVAAALYALAGFPAAPAFVQDQNRDGSEVLRSLATTRLSAGI